MRTILLDKDHNLIDITDHVDHVIFKFGGNSTVKLFLTDLPKTGLINNHIYRIYADNTVSPKYKIVAVELV